MKKIAILLFIASIFLGNISLGQWFTDCGAEPPSTASSSVVQTYQDCIANQSQSNSSSTTIENSCSEYDRERTDQTNWTCPEWYSEDSFTNSDNKTFSCCNPNPTTTTTTTTTPTATTPVAGITCDEDKLLNGQCKLNIYDTLNIRQNARDKGDATSVGIFVQDAVLSATFFIGTVVTVAIIVSWLLYIFAAWSGKDPSNAKKWLIGSLVGLLIVVTSYIIIRLVQYIAKGF